MSAAVHRGLSLRTGSATEYQFGRDGRDTHISSWLAPKVNNLSEETAWKWERRFFFFLGWKGARECTSACVRFSFLCRPFPHIQTSSIIHQKDLIFIPKWTLFYNVVWTREKMALWDGRSGGAEERRCNVWRQVKSEHREKVKCREDVPSCFSCGCGQMETCPPSHGCCLSLQRLVRGSGAVFATSFLSYASHSHHFFSFFFFFSPLFRASMT